MAIQAGSTIQITSVAEDNKGESWLKIVDPEGDAYVPAGRAVIGTTNVGYSLREIEVAAASGLASFVDEEAIRAAVAELRADPS
jgi:hypothetical protein